jgi:hypothetical protein
MVVVQDIAIIEVVAVAVVQATTQVEVVEQVAVVREMFQEIQVLQALKQQVEAEVITIMVLNHPVEQVVVQVALVALGVLIILEEEQVVLQEIMLQATQILHGQQQAHV